MPDIVRTVLEMPEALVFDSTEFIPHTGVIAGATTYSLEEQTFQRNTSRYTVVATTPMFNEFVGNIIEAWLLSAQTNNYIYWPVKNDTLYRHAGVKLSQEHAGSDIQLQTTGWTTNRLPKAGTWISIRSADNFPNLLRLTQPVSPDSNGNAVLSVFPNTRRALPNDAPIDLINPRGIFRLTQIPVAARTDLRYLLPMTFEAVQIQ